MIMKIKAPDGKANIAGLKIAKMRMALKPKVSQRMLADRLQLLGFDMQKNDIQTIENRSRVINDIELKAIAQVLNTTTDELLKEDD